MPSAEENLHLCWLVIQQKMTNGKLEGIDWAPIATALGLPTDAAANIRWKRLRKELTENGGPKAPEEGTPAKKKTTNPKAKKTGEEGKAAGGETPVKKRAPKKRKAEVLEESEDVKESLDGMEEADETDVLA